jgi:hypothetical protein
VFDIAIWSRYVTLYDLYNKQLLNYAARMWHICIIIALRHYVLCCYLPRANTDSASVATSQTQYDMRRKHGTQPLSIYDSYLYRTSLFFSPWDIRKKVIVSSLKRKSCNNCWARQFVKCCQQVFLMAHPLLCIRSPPAGAIDFFDGRPISEKAWW